MIVTTTKGSCLVESDYVSFTYYLVLGNPRVGQRVHVGEANEIGLATAALVPADLAQCLHWGHTNPRRFVPE